MYEKWLSIKKKKKKKNIFITVLKQGYGCPGIEQTSPAAFYL